MKKIFITSISMLPIDKLTPLYYSFEGSDNKTEYKTCYPSIPMIEKNMRSGDEAEIIAVMTDDDNDRTRENYKVFLKELEALSLRLGTPLSVSKTVKVPHNEDKAKLVSLLRELCSVYEEASEVYMDLTYGTKVTSIEMFSSLVFGAKVKNCNIRSIVYGKFNHAENSTDGRVYDIRALYDIVNLIYAADHLPGNKIEELLGQFWG